MPDRVYGEHAQVYSMLLHTPELSELSSPTRLLPLTNT